MTPPDETFFLRKPFRFGANPFNSCTAALITEVAYEIAHDGDTFLGAVRGYTKMVLDGHAGPINDTIRRYLEIIDQNSWRLRELHHKLHLLVSGQKEQKESSSAADVLSQAVTDSERLLESGMRLQSTHNGGSAEANVPNVALYALFRGILVPLLRIYKGTQHEDIEFSLNLAENDAEIEFTVAIHGGHLRPGELYDTLMSHEGRDHGQSIACAVVDLYCQSAIEIRGHGREPVVVLRLPRK